VCLFVTVGIELLKNVIKKHPSTMAFTLNFPRLSITKFQGFSNLPVQLSHLTISTDWLKYFRPTPFNEKLVKTKWLVKKRQGGGNRTRTFTAAILRGFLCR